MPVFISHSQKDEAAYSSLCLIIDGAKIERWDPEQMSFGESLAGQLRSAICACELCVFVATKQSVKSSWCNAELGAFWGAGKRVIVYVAESDVREDDLPPEFRGDLWTNNAGELLQAVTLELAKARLPSHRSIRAACCSILKDDTKQLLGTGYLIGPTLLATTPFVVDVAVEVNLRYKIKFYGKEERTAVPAVSDTAAGVAILRLEAPCETIQSVPLIETAETGKPCYGQGCVELVPEVFIPFTGEVIAEEYLMRSGIPRILIQSPMLTTGSVVGMGGSPVWTEHGVIGHIHKMINKSDKRPIFGLFYVTPSRIVSEILRNQLAE